MGGCRRLCAQVLAYLSSQGYPQERRRVEDEDREADTHVANGAWGCGDDDDDEDPGKYPRISSERKKHVRLALSSSSSSSGGEGESGGGGVGPLRACNSWGGKLVTAAAATLVAFHGLLRRNIS